MALVLIDRTAGTAIGDMTGGGGRAAAFDGTTSQAYAASATTTGNDDIGWIGKTLAGPKKFGQAVVYGSNNHGFKGNANPSITINIRGKAGTAPSSRTDGTVVGTATFTDTGDESGGRTINSTDLATAWDHLFVDITGSGAFGGLAVAELVLYENVTVTKAVHHYRTMQVA